MTFTVPGRPVPKQRPRVDARGRVYIPRRTREYEALVASCARAAGVRPIEGPVRLKAVFYFAAHPPGDLDNYIKSLADGLNGIAWRDDRQVVRLEAEKVVAGGEERAEVEVGPWKAGA